jgi:uncharacterized protein (TIGR00369 family)
MLGARRLDIAEPLFGLEAAARVISEALPPWVQQLGLLVERVEPERPRGAPADWQPGAVVRLPYSHRIRLHDGRVCPQALTALADSAMLVACAAVWNGYKAMVPTEQTVQFLRPVNFDVFADARVVRIGRTASSGRVTLYGAGDKRPVGTMAIAYAMT